MKKFSALCVMALGTLISVDCVVAGQWEVQQSVDYFVPEDALWDQALGGEMKLVYWQQPGLGLAFSAGLSQWESAGERTALPSTTPNFIPSQVWDGDIQYVAVGASLQVREYYTSRDLGECQLTLEAGCHYMRCNSQLELVQTQFVANPPGFQQVVTNHTADCDDGVVGRVGASLSVQLNGQSSVFVTGGYQFDIDRGTISVDSLGQSTSLDLSAFFARVGLAFFLK